MATYPGQTRYPVNRTVPLFRVSTFLAIALALGGTSCHRDAGVSQITVAAAANLSETAQSLGTQFETQTGIHPVFSFASTAQLTNQIENAAPFDVFLSADAQHVDQLQQKNLLEPGTPAPYAIGVLALWFPSSGQATHRLEDLAAPEIRTIAVAKPELAPYGQAAVEALHSAGIWDQVNSKIVYAENISMAKQYGVSKNADAVFTAYSLVLKDGGLVIQVSESLHQPITQKLGILASSTHKTEAKKFTDFVLRGKGREILSNYGYRLP
jgi:molybdate transport system substrate-binding protein